MTMMTSLGPRLEDGLSNTKQQKGQSMTNQEILANGPEGWTHVCISGFYWKLLGFGKVWHWNKEKSEWKPSGSLSITRSRSDIERIVYLESVLKGETS